MSILYALITEEIQKTSITEKLDYILMYLREIFLSFFQVENTCGLKCYHLYVRELCVADYVNDMSSASPSPNPNLTLILALTETFF